MFLRLLKPSFTALLLVILLQLVFSPLLYSLSIRREVGQSSTQTTEEKGSSSPQNEPFFVSQKSAQPSQYQSLVRKINAFRESAPRIAESAAVAELKQSIEKELDVAKENGAPLLRRLEYQNWLQDQVKTVAPSSSIKEKITSVVNTTTIGIGSLFFDQPKKAIVPANDNVLIPMKPSAFKFNDADVTVETLEDAAVSARADEPFALFKLIESVRQKITSIWRASPALAENETDLPSVADVQADDEEVLIDSSISELAGELAYDPVLIANYIRSHVTYEPYSGAQKGSVGCLRQLICNDIDASSLTIALLRASGIPARYEHSFARIPVNQLKALLGVDQVKTVYVALKVAGLSPKLTSTAIPNGTSIDDADLEAETELALEWTWVEAYIEYDERGGNISYGADKDTIAAFSDDASLRAYLAVFPKKQWTNIEPLINRAITRVRNPVAADSAGINAKQFWLDYYQYQGQSAPIDKFHDDVLTASGLDGRNSAYVSSYSLSVNDNDYEILPPTLPYVLVSSAENNSGSTIATAAYSVLPNAWRQTVFITLRSQDGTQTFLDKTFYASEINNQALYLRYNGATQTDADVIASYGGLASTPAPLVSIVPYLDQDSAITSGTTPLEIGDTLVLETQLGLNGTVIHESQKFSIAGNDEGMFIAFSSVAADPNLDNLNESGLLAQGTEALARQYLRHLIVAQADFSNSLDYAAGFRFMRAIVTQNRSLNVFDGLPTTFDFSGLSMDAATDVNDYSRRGNYKNHQDDFRLVFGLEASRYEGRLFTDVAGLDGISTVSGLQYAYNHPETYTVHVVTSANQSEVDGLNISASIKQQITDALAAGAAAVVPDQNIADGNFRGIIYALLSADGTGQYAIGEQVANGGYTTDPVQQRYYTDEDNRSWLGSLIDLTDTQELFYQEEQYSDSIMCRISQSVKDSVMNRSDWLDMYGYPCNQGSLLFGTTHHNFIQTSNASHFNSPDKYDYWVRSAQVRVVLENDKNKDNDFLLSNIRLDGIFKFDLISGTYFYSGHYGSFPSNRLAVYYEPNATIQDSFRGRGRVIYNDVMIKLLSFHYDTDQYLCSSGNLTCNDPNYVGAVLGYPVGNRKAAAPHVVDWGMDTRGEYQNFIGGQIYRKTSGLNKTYYVPEEIASFYNASENCLAECGTGGIFGFPDGDPIKKNDGITIKQNFEIGEGIIWNMNTGVVGTEYAADYYCDEIDTNNDFIIGKAALQGLWEGGDEFVKGAIVFGATTFAIGSTIDFVAGTHGGATIAAWSLIGAGVTYGIAQIYSAGIDNVLTGVNSRVQYEIKHSSCTARVAYLAARYVPEFVGIMVGSGRVVSQTAKELKGITLANNIFTASASDFVPRLKSAFANNLRVLLPVFKRGENDVGSIVDGAQERFNQETIYLSKQLQRSLTAEELSAVASKNFSTGLKEAVDVLGWRKLPNRIPSIEDANPFSGGIARSDGKFIMKGGKIVDGRGYSLNGEVKGVISNGVLYYGKVGSNPSESYYHSQFTRGSSVDSAFTLRFNNKGELIEYNNISGHYQPNSDRLLLLDYVLQESRVDLSKAQRVIFSF